MKIVALCTVGHVELALWGIGLWSMVLPLLRLYGLDSKIRHLPRPRFTRRVVGRWQNHTRPAVQALWLSDIMMAVGQIF